MRAQLPGGSANDFLCDGLSGAARVDAAEAARVSHSANDIESALPVIDRVKEAVAIAGGDPYRGQARAVIVEALAI